jgi:hypothetical protein
MVSLDTAAASFGSAQLSVVSNTMYVVPTTVHPFVHVTFMGTFEEG